MSFAFSLSLLSACQEGSLNSSLTSDGDGAKDKVNSSRAGIEGCWMAKVPALILKESENYVYMDAYSLQGALSNNVVLRDNAQRKELDFAKLKPDEQKAFIEYVDSFVIAYGYQPSRLTLDGDSIDSKGGIAGLTLMGKVVNDDLIELKATAPSGSDGQTSTSDLNLERLDCEKLNAYFGVK